ncbi:protein MON2 homolog [Condylostylus longicornis]|uniref:protein MON2 homolog n=1 Tax=Condylostylus longicornis TaxID=2530218 RepID=UPI00244E0730|nr:protein MON2 homolog [Condylostylus longicornis]
MLSSKGENQYDNIKILADTLKNDFKSLAYETRKKYPNIKESCEEAIVKLNNSVYDQQSSIYYMVNQILYPLIQGCETKDIKIVRFCLGMMQRLITQQVVDQKGALYITDALWMLMENNVEEVKLIQTVTLLLTTNSVVHGETLAKSMVLCFRLYYSKNPTVSNISGATIRQLVSLVFERTSQAIKNLPKQNIENTQSTENKGEENEVENCTADAFLLFQDLIKLINSDQPVWLFGIKEISTTFGLELVEIILNNYSNIFFEIPKFTILLKEQVCALIIKLFSPNIKHRATSAMYNTTIAADKPHFALSVRLLRAVSILVQKFHSILVTECEIFLSLIVKFLDLDKPNWQRALALEVEHQMIVQPKLITCFCRSYDMKDHATNILEDMVTSFSIFIRDLLKNFIQTAFNNQQTSSQNSISSTTNLSNQCGFSVSGIWIPLLFPYSPGKCKATYLEMLDKIEPPSVAEGYGITLTYAAVLDIVRSIRLIIDNNSSSSDKKSKSDLNSDLELNCQLIKSTWTGLLSAFICLLDAAADESTISRILNAMQDYLVLCGALELFDARDAFITAICRSAFPPSYGSTIVNIINHDNNSTNKFKNMDINLHGNDNFNETDFRNQLQNSVTHSQSALLAASVTQGPVMLSAKNLQCMKAVLNLANHNGSILGSSWHIVLITLQNLVCILGLKLSTGGGLQITKPPAESNIGIQTAVMADLPIISQLLSEVFESSKNLDDVALHHLIDALCKLSCEAMELAYSNREPSLFAVAKLLEIGLANMFRIETIWRSLTNHLLEVCQHRHIRMREWGVEAITYLLKVALQYQYQTPLKENMVLQTMLLSPLCQLSCVPHGDVRQRQLECVLQILNSSGEIISFGWPVILEIIGAVSDHHGEPLIRTAFQCLQLVITDFLPIMPWRCLPLCINTASRFGSQTQELNISLTAIGLMWNISDYFNQNQEKLIQAEVGEIYVLPDFPGIVNIPQFDKLWMCLYARIGDLCVDSRPAVRKSAGQTLFSTISAHGTLLSSQTWQALVWSVLFPLLDKVRSLSSTASNEKVDTSGNILIHHSRNTAQKQWAETHVLILSGVSRVFNAQKNLLQMLGDFSRAWSLMLEFIQNAALNRIDEVSLAALKSFQEIMFYTCDKRGSNKIEIKSELDAKIWNESWKTWLNIGTECVQYVEHNANSNEFYIPNQAFLTALIQIFPAIFQNIRTRFSFDDFNNLSNVLTNVIEIPYQSDSVPYIMTTLSESALTPLHDAVLDSIDLIQKEATNDGSKIRYLIPSLFKQLLSFSKLSCIQPTQLENKLRNDHSGYANFPSVETTCVNYIPFGEKAFTLAVKLYKKTATDEDVIKEHILENIIQALKIPLALKYNCLSSSTWKLAISSLFEVLQTGLKVARTRPNDFTEMWNVLAETFDKFLFPTSVCTIEDRGLEEIVLDETIDCQVIELIREEILPYSHEIPHQFIIKIVVILNKGSIHSAAETSLCCESDWKLRELFAKTCFETLLQFSLLIDSSNNNNFNENINGNTNNSNNCVNAKEDFAGRLAITALLHRFQEVLKRYNDDERHSGKCPLPRYRLSEISFVLKAIETLISSMKKSPPSKVNKTAWNQIIALYPFLVDCTVTTSQEVSRALRETLLQYAELLHTPKLHESTATTTTLPLSGESVS